MRIWITGAGGFVGSAVHQWLSRESVAHADGPDGGAPPARVTALTRQDHDWERPFETSSSPNFQAPTHWVHCAFQGPEPGLSPEEFRRRLAANERMAEHSAKAAARLGCRRVVLVSSGSVYAEKDGPVGAHVPGLKAHASKGTGYSNEEYAQSLLRVEAAFEAQQKPGSELVIARLFYPYGPGQSVSRLIPRIARRIHDGETILLRPSADHDQTSGRPRINPVFIQDAAEAIGRLTASALPGIHRAVIDVGGPEILTIAELASKIGELIGRPATFKTAGDASAARDLYCSTTELEKIAGFRPSVTIQTGLRAALNPLTLKE